MAKLVILRPVYDMPDFFLTWKKKITIYGSFKCLIICIFLSKAKRIMLPIKTEFCAEGFRFLLKKLDPRIKAL